MKTSSLKKLLCSEDREYSYLWNNCLLILKKMVTLIFSKVLSAMSKRLDFMSYGIAFDSLAAWKYPVKLEN